MPTIPQLPAATAVSSADDILISQAGAACAASVGLLLASTQPAIIVGSPSLLGRTSIGSGGPEAVDLGLGMSLSGGTLVADGSDHAAFPTTASLSVSADVVISNQGSPMLMQASLLRGLFSAGENVVIDSNGTISTTASLSSIGNIGSGSSVGELPVVTTLAAQDLVAVNQAGSNAAISYANFLGGVTIDQAQPAGPAADSDTLWAAQGSNVMVSQSFGAIWVWIASHLPSYKLPVVELTTSVNLDTTVHNRRILICSQPITLTPLTSNMGSGFECTVINASRGNVTLGAGFVSSSGSLALTPWQSATLCCATYSGGTIAFATMPSAGPVGAVPGQVTALTGSATTSTAVTVSWQPPSTGGSVASYIVQSRLTGTTSWNSGASIAGATTYQLTALQAATSYDIIVTAQNAAGLGAASAVLTVSTSTSQPALPPQVSGLTASPTSGSAIQLSWSAQSGTNAATSFTVQYRVTGSATWTSSIPGLTGTATTVSSLQPATSYDFSVVGVNTAGSGPASAIATAATSATSPSVSSITWNLAPSGTYTAGGGAIGVNARVTPATSTVQFGFSTSATTPPASWTVATLVNTNLWGAYVSTPPTAGTYYAWAEGLDGSSPTVYSGTFVVVAA